MPMSLRTYTPPSKSVPIGPDNALAVRAFGFDDVQHLLINRSGLIQTALELFEGGQFTGDAPNDPERVREFMFTLLAKLPDLVAEVIAIAADEPDMAPTARRLPAPVQLELLMGIYELTFSEPGAVGKFFGRLADLMTSMPRPSKGSTPVMGGPVQPAHGSNDSGATLPT